MKRRATHLEHGRDKVTERTQVTTVREVPERGDVYRRILKKHEHPQLLVVVPCSKNNFNFGPSSIVRLSGIKADIPVDMIPFQPVIRPAIPFVDSITNGLHAGTTIRIWGSIPHSAQDFVINLANGPNINEDHRSPITFYFNPRFGQKYVARNTYQHCSWGKEESNNPNGAFPFARGAHFELLITVTVQEYTVSVNSKHFISFFHRMPFQRVNTLQILKDVIVDRILLSSSPSSASPAPMPVPVVFYDLTLPFVGVIRNGLRSGNSVSVTGSVPNNSNGFQINFASGATLDGPSRSPIGFHFNPRFNQNKVARNSFNREWGKEENGGGLNLSRGQGFEIQFLMKCGEFEVVVNGRYFCIFAYRTPLENVNTLQITGDVQIAKIVLPSASGQQPFGEQQFTGPQPVYNPAIPFVDVIPRLRPGYMIVITGTVPDFAQGFQINFAFGATLDGPSRSPIAYHFNPRFKEDVLVQNTFNQGWGKEERCSKMGLRKGKGFEILFLVQLYEYKVSVNGQNVCSFAHRLPIEHVTSLQITGDVKVAKIVINEGQQQRVPSWHQPFAGLQPIYHPTVPFEHPIPNFIAPGSTLTIIGMPKSYPDKFNVDLFSVDRGRDIFFHFNPRYKKPNPYVVRNSCFGGVWGEEQTVTPFFNFLPNVRFNLRIICDNNNFITYVNDQLFCYFKHRMPMHLITHLRIEGDLDIDSITFN